MHLQLIDGKKQSDGRENKKFSVEIIPSNQIMNTELRVVEVEFRSVSNPFVCSSMWCALEMCSYWLSLFLISFPLGNSMYFRPFIQPIFIFYL